MDGFFLSVRLEGVVEGPLTCFFSCTSDAGNEWTALCLMFDFKIPFNTGLGLSFLSCWWSFTYCMPLDSSLLHVSCHWRPEFKQRIFLVLIFYTKNYHVSKKAYMDMEARTSVHSSTSTYKGASLLNWVQCISGNTWASLFLSCCGKNFPLKLVKTDKKLLFSNPARNSAKPLKKSE